MTKFNLSRDRSTQRNTKQNKTSSLHTRNSTSWSFQRYWELDTIMLIFRLTTFFNAGLKKDRDFWHNRWKGNAFRGVYAVSTMIRSQLSKHCVTLPLNCQIRGRKLCIVFLESATPYSNLFSTFSCSYSTNHGFNLVVFLYCKYSLG